MFSASVGLSRNWEPFDAGEEIVINTLEKLEGEPKFFLLFPTIHFEKNNGFQKLLDGVFSQLNKSTPLLGCTVAGFINPKGCYTRGVTSLAIADPDMQITVALGKNAKKTPQKAAEEFANMIKKEKSKSNSGALFLILPGSTLPKDIFHRTRRISNSLLSSLFDKFFPLYLALSKEGVAKESEFINKLYSRISEKMIGISAWDNNLGFSNYQFFGNRVLQNSAVGIHLSFSGETIIKYTTPLKIFSEKLLITKKDNSNYLINEINGLNAPDFFFKELKLEKKYLTEELLRKITLGFPISAYYGTTLFNRVIGLYSDKFLGLTTALNTSEIYISTASGSSIINSFDKVTDGGEKTNFVFGVSCAVLLEEVGSKVFEVKNILEKKQIKNFLFLFGGSEHFMNEVTPISSQESSVTTFF